MDEKAPKAPLIMRIPSSGIVAIVASIAVVVILILVFLPWCLAQLSMLTFSAETKTRLAALREAPIALPAEWQNPGVYSAEIDEIMEMIAGPFPAGYSMTSGWRDLIWPKAAEPRESVRINFDLEIPEELREEFEERRELLEHIRELVDHPEYELQLFHLYDEYSRDRIIIFHVCGSLVNLRAAESFSMGDESEAVEWLVTGLRLHRRHPLLHTWSLQNAAGSLGIKLDVVMAFARKTTEAEHLRQILDHMDELEVEIFRDEHAIDILHNPLALFWRYIREGHDLEMDFSRSVFENVDRNWDYYHTAHFSSGFPVAPSYFVYQASDRLWLGESALFALFQQATRSWINRGPMDRLVREAIAADTLTTFLTGVEDALKDSRARYDLARLVVALRLHRLERGHYPETLDELVPDYLSRLPDERMMEERILYRAGEGVIFRAEMPAHWELGSIIYKPGNPAHELGDYLIPLD